MSVLVTGGAGFIGSHVCKKLLNEGIKVFCIDDFNDYYDPSIKRENIRSLLKNLDFKLFEGDIRNCEFLEYCFENNKIREIIHLAARAGVRPSLQNPLLYSEVNIAGTLNLLELAKKHKIENFVFSSSSSVYGNNKKVPFSENDIIENMISPYAITKKAGENFCFNYHHLYGIPITCLRFFTVYGPSQRPDMAIHKFTKSIYEGREICMFGDGNSERDYTYIDDIVDGVIKAFEKKSAFEIFNLGESKTTKLIDLIHIIAECFGKKARIKQYPKQPGDVDITYADIEKAKKNLGYNPQIKVKDGIPLFVEWFLKNQKSNQ
jgi:UDP-glucuronate 4-epimerase